MTVKELRKALKTAPPNADVRIFLEREGTVDALTNTTEALPCFAIKDCNVDMYANYDYVRLHPRYEDYV